MSVVGGRADIILKRQNVTQSGHEDFTR
jgi:hypothetical protein